MDEKGLAKPVAGGAGASRSPRRRTAFKGVLETLSGPVRVAIRNISCTGALVEAEEVPSAGRDAVLKAEGLELFCSIVWAEEGRCGLAFDETLTPQQVLELHQITPEAVRSAELKAAAENYILQGWVGYQ
jgi:hypothetical protein